MKDHEGQHSVTELHQGVFSWLFDTLSRRQKVDGSGPRRCALPPISNAVNEDISPISSGTSSLRSFADNPSDFRFVKRPSSVGMVDVSKLLVRFK